MFAIILMVLLIFIYLTLDEWDFYAIISTTKGWNKV